MENSKKEQKSNNDKTENAQSDTNLVDRWKKINYLMYMDDIKLFVKNEKELETLIIFTNPSARAGYDTRSIF